MTKKESQHKWYLAHRDEQIARTRAYQAEHPEVYRQQALAYYYAHRDERLDYYKKYSKERTSYSKEYRRRSCVVSKESGNYIRGIAKSPYPTNGKCSFCKRTSHRPLHWHHWNDNHPEDGFWVCISCHGRIEIWFKKSLNKAKFIKAIKSIASSQ